MLRRQPDLHVGVTARQITDMFEQSNSFQAG